ncbi:MAG: alpha/beta hydrolase [Muribaculaceae bacterium]
MKNRNCIYVTLLLLIMSSFTIVAQSWHSDILGDGYQMRYINMPNDYSGKVRSTVIRKKSKCGDKRAILYVHGYNDYFFQEEMGDRFIDSCYNFYAIDLRKYGRSLMPGQRAFEVRDIAEYYADIDSALNIIVKDGNKSIILMGHSTGGLTLSSYMATQKGGKYPIKGLILNSPFLDMNLGKFTENVLIPVVSWYSKISKGTNISQGDSNAYAQSLLKKYHGEWNYNVNWKKEISPDVTSGWIGAIHNAQKNIQKGSDIKVPILLMHSAKSVWSDSWSPEHNNGDVVLDVNDISKYGRKLGRNYHELNVHGGIHDLMLSRKPVREALYNSIFKWLRNNNN